MSKPGNRRGMDGENRGEFRVMRFLPYQVTVEGLWQALIVQHD